jgi:hypothetical protein
MGDGFRVRNLLLAMTDDVFGFLFSFIDEKKHLLVGWLAVLTFRPDVER